MAKCWMLWAGTEYVIGYGFAETRGQARMICFAESQDAFEEFIHTRVLRVKDLDDKEAEFMLDKYKQPDTNAFLPIATFCHPSDQEEGNVEYNLKKLVELGLACIVDGDYLLSNSVRNRQQYQDAEKRRRQEE